MSESVGKITLDLEVSSDLESQIGTISKRVGGGLKQSLQTAFKSGFGGLNKGMDSAMNEATKSVKSGMKKANEEVKKANQSMMKSTADSIKKTLGMAGSGAKQAFGTIGAKVQTAIAARNARAITETPHAPVTAVPTPASATTAPLTSRGPPKNFDVENAKSQISSIEKEMDIIEQRMSRHKASLRDLKLSYEQAFNPKLKSKISSQIEKEENAILRMTSKMDTLGAKYNKLEGNISAYASAGRGAVSANNAFSNSVKKLTADTTNLEQKSQKMPSIFSKMSGGFRNTGRSAKSANVNVNSFGRGIGGTLGQMMKWMIILPAIAGGIKALASNTFACLKTNSQFSASLKQIYTNLWVAFMPIYQAILPAINALMSALSTATAYIASFINGIFGKTYSEGFKAAQGMVAAKDAMGAYGSASKNAAKASKEAQRSLMGFDKIQKLDKQEDSSAPTLSSPSISMAELDSATTPWAEKFKDVMSKIFQPFKEAWQAEGLNTVNSMKSALKNVLGLLGDIGTAFLNVWTNGTGTRALSTILQIVQNIFNLVGNLAGAFRRAWNENAVGERVIQGIFDILQIVLDTIRDITGATAEWANQIDFSPLLEAISGLLIAIQPVLKVVGDTLDMIWSQYVLPFLSWLIETALPAVLNGLSGLFQFLGEHQGLVENMTVAVVTFFAAFKAVTIISSVINGLMALAGALNWPVIAIAAVIAAGVLLWKNWDWISEKAKEVWSFVQGKFQEFSNFLGGAFTRDWTRDFGIFGETLNSFLKNVSNIWNSIKKIFGGIVDFVAGVFTGNWKKAWNGVKDVFKGIWDLMVSVVKVPINTIISAINGLVTGAVAGINLVISALNHLKFDVPDWIPGFGGKKFGFNIPKITPPKIPYLAQGAYVEANTPQLAMIGDNRHYGEIVAPENKLQEMVDSAVRSVAASGGITKAELEAIINSAVLRIIAALSSMGFYVDGEEMAKAIQKASDRLDGRMNPVKVY